MGRIIHEEWGKYYIPEVNLQDEPHPQSKKSDKAMPPPETLRKWADRLLALGGSNIKGLLKQGLLLKDYEQQLDSRRNFSAFVKNYLPYSRQRAYQMRWAAEVFTDAPHLERYDWSAIIKLSAPLLENGHRIRQKAARMAASGKLITHALAQELIGKVPIKRKKGGQRLELTTPDGRFRVVVIPLQDGVISWRDYQEAANTVARIAKAVTD